MLAVFKNCLIWAWTGPLTRVPEVAHILSFYPRGSKWSLFSLYGYSSSRYGMIFKISKFGHEIWNLKTSPKVAHVLSFYSRGSKLSLFFALRATVFKIEKFQALISLIWLSWLMQINSKRYIYTLFQPQRPEIVLVFTLLAAIFSWYSHF